MWTCRYIYIYIYYTYLDLGFLYISICSNILMVWLDCILLSFYFKFAMEILFRSTTLVWAQNVIYLANNTRIQLLAIWIAHSYRNAVSALSLYILYNTPWRTSTCYSESTEQRQFSRKNIKYRMYVCDEWFDILRVAVKCQADEACLNKMLNINSVSCFSSDATHKTLQGGWCSV